MRIAVCEDEPAVVEEITDIVKSQMMELNMDCTVDSFFDGESFEKSGLDYDLIFMDCRLPDGNGLEIAQRLREKGCGSVLIFVTAFNEYVYKSFEVGTFRYLLKPIDEFELRAAVTGFVKTSGKTVFINVPTREKTHRVNLNEIIYIESDAKHTIVRHIDWSCESVKSISEYQAEINDPRFFRTHRRYLVNMKYIVEIDRNIATLINGEKIEISRRNLPNFSKCYMNFLKYSM